MATNSKVFVSPGVYTSEVDLSFVAQSVGVTTLGIVGETLKGPAFEPIFIRNFDEFSTFFGGTSPEKFINTQIPKYEASYIAKSYLQQSNQLFVTRVLGLSGYDAGPSWTITSVANVDPTTIQFKCSGSTTVDCEIICTGYTKTPISVNFTGCTGNIDSIGFTTSFPAAIANKINTSYELFNGSTSVISNDLKGQIFDIINTPSNATNSIYYFGAIDGDDYAGLSGYTAQTNVFGVNNVNADLIDYSAPQNDSWYYSLFDNVGNSVYSGTSFYSKISNFSQISQSSNCASFFNYSVSGVSGSINYNNFTIDVVLPYSEFSGVSLSAVNSTFSACTLDVTVSGDSQTSNQGYYPIDGFYTGSTDLTNLVLIIPADEVISDLTLPAIPIVYFIGDYTVLSGYTITVPLGTTLEFVSPTTGTTNNFTSGCLKYILVSEDSSVTTEWTVCVTLENPCASVIPSNTGSYGTGTIQTCYSGTVTGYVYTFEGVSYSDYDNLVLATLRSRGVATYSSDNGPVYEVANLSDVSLNVTGATYSGVTKNPYNTFGINLTNKDGEIFFFETSFSNSDAKYLGKVFGMSNFSKPRTTVPVFVEEDFQTLLTYAYRKGYIRGINSQLTALPDAKQGVNPTSIAWYLEKYQSPTSPWLVSELRGNKVYNLFKFTTIADGDAANTEVKISITNISFNNGTFDVLVRDFYDTDNNPVVIEKFTNCSMNPNENTFVAKKIGTLDGEYELNSKYVMLEINEDAPIDALPCGFLGYNYREYAGARSPFPIIKNKYDYPGEVIYNPPFGIASGNDNSTTSAGDNVRRTYLGISDTIGIDADFFGYKGKQLPLNICEDTTGEDWAFKTKGFHMDKNASGITIPNTFSTSGTSAFFVGNAEFTADPNNESNPYYRLYARKFSLLVQGGFDGWDIYRESRTNSDRFALGKTGYLKGACVSTKYPSATGWGAFKQITVGDNSQDWANTDYYAYLLGQRTFSNPEAVNINVFVTPGIDYVNNSNLVEDAIEMVEFSRADSLYITTTPDYNMFVPSVGESTDLIYPQEAVDNLDQIGLDSNYSATYYPWVLTRDSVNNTQIYLPPTAEVTRNLALTDNIAFPWFAAAGYTRGIVNAVKARKKLTQEDRDTLYNGRINPIATFSDVGTVIWGNKTLQVKQSALDRINVRRLLLQARKLISAVSVRLLFEQNDDKVRQDFLNAVNPILDGIRRDRGLYDFRVSVSSDAADLDRNQMTGKIYIKPTKSLEFIDITFYITPTGASFENI